MWLNQLFTENPIDFRKRCRNRIVFGICFILSGAAAIGLSFAVRNHTMVIYLEQDCRDSISRFHGGIGFGLAASGVISIIRDLQCLRDPEFKEKRRIYETDERNCMLGLRCWVYIGYTMMLTLCIGVFVGGFISMTVAEMLVFIAVLFAILPPVLREFLQKVIQGCCIFLWHVILHQQKRWDTPPGFMHNGTDEREDLTEEGIVA